MPKGKIIKDNLLESLAGSKLFLLLLLVLVILAKHLSRTVLNTPLYIDWFKYILILGCTIVFFILRVAKYNAFYRKKIKDWSDKIILLFHFVFVCGVFWITINVILSFLIVVQSDKESEVFYCDIVTDFTINEDRIMYSFKGKNYILAINHHQSKLELINNYCVRIEVTKSIFNTYILKSGQLYEKTIEGNISDK